MPALMILGASDQRVPPSQGRQWVAALQQIGRSPEVAAPLSSAGERRARLFLPAFSGRADGERRGARSDRRGGVGKGLG